MQFGDTFTNATVEAGIGYTGTGAVEELDRFFYHPDHIGSSSVITNALGAVSECMAYMPFGEILASQKSTSYAVPYLFTSKELDSETGLYYFGARYYDPNEGRWWGVDPLAEKYPNVSPFLYCFNNPIKYIDPDGRIPWPISKDGNGQGWNTKFGWFGEKRTSHVHQGVDINKNTGTDTDLGLPVFATHTGTVVSVKPYNTHKDGGGTIVVIQSPTDPFNLSICT